MKKIIYIAITGGYLFSMEGISSNISLTPIPRRNFGSFTETNSESDTGRSHSSSGSTLVDDSEGLEGSTPSTPTRSIAGGGFGSAANLGAMTPRPSGRGPIVSPRPEQTWEDVANSDSAPFQASSAAAPAPAPKGFTFVQIPARKLVGSNASFEAAVNRTFIEAFAEYIKQSDGSAKRFKEMAAEYPHVDFPKLHANISQGKKIAIPTALLLNGSGVIAVSPVKSRGGFTGIQITARKMLGSDPAFDRTVGSLFKGPMARYLTQQIEGPKTFGLIESHPSVDFPKLWSDIRSGKKANIPNDLLNSPLELTHVPAGSMSSPSMPAPPPNFKDKVLSVVGTPRLKPSRLPASPAQAARPLAHVAQEPLEAISTPVPDDDGGLHWT